MPPSDAPDAEIHAMISYLKTLATPGTSATTAPLDRPRMVTLVTRDGREIRGAQRNEDAFSIQIADHDGRLQGYFKSDLRTITRDGPSAPNPPTRTPGITSRDTFMLDGRQHILIASHHASRVRVA